MSKIWMIYGLLTLIMIAPVVISWITITSPSPSNDLRRRSLLTVTSNVANESQPTVWMGLFASCGRRNDSARIHCVNTVLESHFSLQRDSEYDLSVLPSDAPLFVLQLPPRALRAFALTTTCLQCVFLGLLFFMTGLLFSLRRGGDIDKVVLQFKSLLAQMAVVLIYVGAVNMMIVQVYFKKACLHFNVFVAHLGEFDLVASVQHDSFTLAYCGYGLVAIPLMVIVMTDKSPLVTDVVTGVQVGPTGNTRVPVSPVVDPVEDPVEVPPTVVDPLVEGRARVIGSRFTEVF